MRALAPAIFLFGACVSAHAAPDRIEHAFVPTVLVVQENVTKAKRADVVKHITAKPPKLEWEPGLIDLNVVNMLASGLDANGRVFPIVWSLSDSIFRAAVDDGTIKGSVNEPTWTDQQDGRVKLNCQYLIVVTAWKEGEMLIGTIKLFDGRREIWRDDRSTMAQKNGVFDPESASESLANTWSELIAGGPLKKLPIQRAAHQPDPDPGTKPPTIEKPVPNNPPPNNQIVEDAMKRLSNGETYAAIDLLRDAVDAEPMNAERRRTLVTVLMQIGQPLQAALEARRSGKLFPERAEFRILAARAWLAAKNSEEALKDLNEAVAHDPEAPETRLLLGEIQMGSLKFGFAIEHFDKALAKAPGSDGYFLRGLCKYFSGDRDGGSADWQKSGLVPDPLTLEERNRNATRVLALFGESIALDLKAAQPLARTQSKDPATIASIADLLKRCDGALAVLEVLKPPAKHERSYQRFGLALKLLRQAVSETQALLDAPSDDSLAGASITLSEAQNALKEAKDAYEAESAANAATL